MMDLLFVGSPEDVALVREAFDIAMALPMAPTNGPWVVSPEVEAQTRAAWWQLTPEQRDSTQFDHLFRGWTVRWSLLYNEPSPGTRTAAWVTDGIDTLIASAAAAGRTLSIAHINALLAAKASATTTFPENWVEEAEEE